MPFRKNTLSALVALAVTASLAVAPALLEPATATSAVPARSSVTEECANARAAWAVAKSTQAAAHRKLVRARKALRKARHTHRPATIRKAKRHLKQARTRYAVRTRSAHAQAARVGYACSAPNSSARAAGTGMKLDLLSIATGAGGKVIDPTQLTTLLEDLLPGVTSQLTPGQLSALLSGFNGGTPSLTDATVLLGGVFTTEQLQSLLGGAADPALVQALTANIIDALSGLSGVAVPVLDLPTIVGTVTTLFTGLSPATTTTTTTGGGTLCTVLLGLVC